MPNGVTHSPLVFLYGGDDRPSNERLLEVEWLVTNGLGGYASGTVHGAGTRRYHGLFVPNLPAPRGRTVMIPKLAEEAFSSGRIWRLDGTEFADGRLEGDAAAVLSEFRLEWQKPVWTYALEGGTRLEKRVVMPHAQNTVCVQYRLLEGGPVKIRLRPSLACRMHDGSLGYASDWPFTLTAARGRYEIHPFEGAPVLRFALRPCGRFVSEETLLRGVHYRVERARGHDSVENLYSPGAFEMELSEGGSCSVVASTEAWEAMPGDVDAILKAEEGRLEKLLMLAPKHLRQGFAQHLVLAADQFIVLPWTRAEENVLYRAQGERVRTVIAGYHWFTDWGRDTMISLEGLTLCTGRHFEAKAILMTFAHYVKEGLLPNHFPEGHRTAIYNTVDATFWYFHAIDRYFTVTDDKETLEALYPVLEDIVRHHLQGTQYGIYADPRDGLIRAGAEGYALTWMDAKVDEWVVTPRRGKPVEIQALWYNALKLMARWARLLGRSGDDYSRLAKRAFDSFNARFWYERGQHLYDVIDTDKGNDAALRPNQIFTLALRYSVLDRSYWKPVIDAVKEKLLTPVGLRTLDPEHRDYHARYEGDRWARDAAYHQGMVWAWLIGPFVNAWLRVHRDRNEARAMLEGFRSHLYEGGVGSVSEIFDGDAPYTPRGCIAQAWSVAETLRLIDMLEEEHETLTTSASPGKEESYDPPERI